MNIGIIYTAYQAEEFIEMSLNPWMTAKEKMHEGDNLTICAVSMPFEGFDHCGDEEDGTRAFLGIASHYRYIDHVIVRDKPMKETDARGAALRWLVEQGVDYIWQVDADEEYTEKEIFQTIEYLKMNVWITWFRLPFRNLVFTPDQWLAEPFTPPRIHRVIPFTKARCDAIVFVDDNNIGYTNSIDGKIYPDLVFPSMTIPTIVVHPKHYTWLNNERSRRKIAYQTARGWECSFAWDDTKGLVFNEAYYARRGLPLPEILREG